MVVLLFIFYKYCTVFPHENVVAYLCYVAVFCSFAYFVICEFGVLGCGLFFLSVSRSLESLCMFGLLVFFCVF